MSNKHHFSGSRQFSSLTTGEASLHSKPIGLWTRRQLTLVAVLSAASCASVFIQTPNGAYAADGDAAADPAATPAADAPVGFKKSELSAVTASLLNYQKSLKKATIDLRWDILPESKQFTDIRIRSSAPVHEFVVDNAALMSKDRNWLGRLPKATQTDLAKALYPDGKGNLKNFDQGTSDAAFQAYWLDEGGKGLGFVTGTSGIGITATNYYALLRDHYLLTAFLGGRGVSYNILLTGPAKTKQQEINSAGKDIQWRIRFIRVPGHYKDSLGNPADLPAYRFAIAAELKKPIKLTIPSVNGTPTASTGAAGGGAAGGSADAAGDAGDATPTADPSDPGPNNAGILVIFKLNRASSDDNVDVDSDFLLKGVPQTISMEAVALPPDIQAKIDKAKSQSEGNKLDAILQNVGGASVDDLIVKGLLGGTQNSSVITGGLIGSGKVDKVFGVNIERSPLANTSLGVMLGVVPDRDNSLFAGPSLRSGILTLGAGLRAYETDKGNGESNTHAKAAGVLSVDLSRLTREKTPANTFQLADPNAGGGWGQATDEIAANLKFVQWTLSAESNLVLTDEDKNITWEFRQVKDALGADIPAAKQTVFTFTNADFVAGYKKRQFIPAGTYTYSGGGGKFHLSTVMAGHMAGSDTEVNAKSFQAFTYVLHPGAAPAPVVPPAAGVAGA